LTTLCDRKIVEVSQSFFFLTFFGEPKFSQIDFSSPFNSFGLQARKLKN
jgi:hypothetical protein